MMIWEREGEEKFIICHKLVVVILSFLSRSFATPLHLTALSCLSNEHKKNLTRLWIVIVEDCVLNRVREEKSQSWNHKSNLLLATTFGWIMTIILVIFFIFSIENFFPTILSWVAVRRHPPQKNSISRREKDNKKEQIMEITPPFEHCSLPANKIQTCLPFFYVKEYYIVENWELRVCFELF